MNQTIIISSILHNYILDVAFQQKDKIQFVDFSCNIDPLAECETYPFIYKFFRAVLLVAYRI